MGSTEPVLYVAELSANHNQSLDRAFAILDAVSEAGANAVKFQTYTPETMTLNSEAPGFVISNNESLWHGRSLFDLYAEAMTPWEWHPLLFEKSRELGMTPFSSPFDKTAVDFLETLDCSIYKIASFELVDVDLISYAASTGKPLIISTGLGTLSEIADAVQAARDGGCKDITLLKTTSSYPASPEYSNLRTMAELERIFGVKVGISDHTLGIGAAVGATALGATVVEKHVTLNRADGGVDSQFSLEPEEFGDLVREAEVARKAVGEVSFGPSPGDEASLGFRRSLYVTKDVAMGEVVGRENVRAIRPGFGLSIKLFPSIQGLKFQQDVSKGTPLSFEHFK